MQHLQVECLRAKMRITKHYKTTVQSMQVIAMAQKGFQPVATNWPTTSNVCTGSLLRAQFDKAEHVHVVFLNLWSRLSGR